MKSIAFVFLFVVMFVGVEGRLANSGERIQSEFTAPVTEVPLVNSEDRLPLGFTISVIDIPCKDVIDSIPTRLEELGVVFKWTDKDEGSLTVGPFTEKAKLGLVYSSIRQTYYLEIVCRNDLSTNFSGEATLEGLQSDGQWFVITDSKTIEQHSLEFFRKLDF